MSQPVNVHNLTGYPLEPEGVVECGEYLSYQWAIAKAPIYGLNGYIRIPDDQPNHPWEDKEWLCDTDEHPWGEVTYQRGRWYDLDYLPATFQGKGELTINW